MPSRLDENLPRLYTILSKGWTQFDSHKKSHFLAQIYEKTNLPRPVTLKMQVVTDLHFHNPTVDYEINSKFSFQA